MATVFWDFHGITFIDYVKKSQTIRRVLWNNSDPFERRATNETDKISAHKSHHPPRQRIDSHLCSSRNFFLFSNLETWLGEKTFHSNEEPIAAVNEYFKGLQTSYFSEGIKQLEHRWIKCVVAQGEIKTNSKKKNITCFFTLLIERPTYGIVK